MPRTPERLYFFAAALLLHFALLYWLMHSHYGWQGASAPQADTTQFQMVKVVAPPPPPTLPKSGASGITPPSLPVNVSVAAPAIPNTIVTSAPAAFTAPDVQINQDLASKMLSTDPSMGSVAPGTGQLFGLSIRKAEDIIVVLDESGSMTSYIPILQKEIATDFSHAQLIPSCSALGKFDAPGTPDSACDLYEAAKRGIDQNPETTAVFIMTDFEDGETAEDTKKFIQMLKEKNIKLFIRSVEMPAYAGLEDYANASGGSYVCQKPDPANP